MPDYAYRVKDASGRRESGTLAAPNAAQASRSLRSGGNNLVGIHRDFGPGRAAGQAIAVPSRVKRDQVVFLATQLAIMVDTGVPLDEALDSIADQTEHSGLKVLVADLSEQVKGGVEFSAALESHPKAFDNLFVSLMRAGEASGTMGQMLVRASQYMESEREIRKRIKGAMAYPVCMMGFCVLVVIGLMIFILPRFQRIYAGKGAVLPLPTRVLLATSFAMITYWPFILGGLGALITAAMFYFRSEGGRLFLDKVRITAPIIGPMYRKACLARSLRTMATMVSSGVSMLDGLAITAQAAGNCFFARVWTDLAESVKEGSSLSEPLFSCDLIPRTVSQMVAAGERAGKLGPVMDRIAGFCEDDLKVAVKTVTMMIEPIMIVVMGLVVGGIALALLLPVFSIAKVMTH